MDIYKKFNSFENDKTSKITPSGTSLNASLTSQIANKISKDPNFNTHNMESAIKEISSAIRSNSFLIDNGKDDVEKEK